MRPVFTLYGALLLVVLFGLWGCNEMTSVQQPGADAVAVLIATDGNDAEGVVRFARIDAGVRIMAEIKRLSPGLHGFHIHRFGDCRAPDAVSAGEHFNPQASRHGGPESEHRHAGDLGNLSADAQGVAIVDRVAPLIQIDGPDSIIGRSVIVHADPDDLTSQPSGASGVRLACGVIGWAAR